MSSHHVVRDQQEPALVIADLGNSSYESVKSLLEWSPTILVLNACLKEVIDWGINIDWVITNRNPSKFLSNISITSNKILHNKADEQPIEVALNYLVQHSFDAVNIIGEYKKLHALLEPFENQLQLAVHNNISRSYYVNRNFQKWVLANVKFEIYPPKNSIETSGTIDQSPYLISECDGIVSFSNKNPFWLVEYI